MKWPPLDRNRVKPLLWTTGMVGALLLVTALVGAWHSHTRPAPLDAERIRERHEFLEEARQADARILGSYQWLDREKGLLRLPLDRALELTLQEWQDPVGARSNLIARSEKAREPSPPPPEPGNPSE